MALLQLIARLGLDTSGFSSGLRQAEGQAKRSSATIGGSFKQAFGAGLGIGAIGMATAAIGKILRDIKQLRSDAERFGVELDQGVVASITELESRLGRMKVDVFAQMAKPIGALATAIQLAVDGVRQLFYEIRYGSAEGNKKMQEIVAQREESIQKRLRGGFNDDKDANRDLDKMPIDELLRIQAGMVHQSKGLIASGKMTPDVAGFRAGRLGAINALLDKAEVTPRAQGADRQVLKMLEAIATNTSRTANNTGGSFQ